MTAEESRHPELTAIRAPAYGELIGENGRVSQAPTGEQREVAVLD